MRLIFRTFSVIVLQYFVQKKDTLNISEKEDIFIIFPLICLDYIRIDLTIIRLHRSNQKWTILIEHNDW